MRSLLVDQLTADYRSGLSPETVIDEVHAAIEAADDPGIFIHLVPKATARKAARQLGAYDPAKPLWGIPFAVKDNIDVKGLPTTAGCPAFAYTAKETAFAVQRLLDAGAILIGKANLDQFATGLVGVRTPYPVPRNAIDPALVPGGSSSGSAVAVSRGLVTFALGTDTAGSGRVPAALNNIVGLKPSLGLVSTSGVVPACRTLDCVSVFALTAGDAWAALDVMAGHDPQEAYSRTRGTGSRALPPVLRVGVPSKGSLEFFGDKQAAAAFKAGVADLEALGYATRSVDIGPLREVAELLYGGPWVAERYQAIRDFFESDPASLHPTTRKIIGGAKKLSAADAFAGLYRLQEMQRICSEIWKSIDVLAVPTIPTVCTLQDLKADPIGPNNRLGTYTNFVNLLDLSAIAIPSRFRSDKRAAGITLIATGGRDGLIATLGARLHAAADVTLGATQQRTPAAKLVPCTAPAGMIEIVAVGAHMSWLPLNHELTSQGGQFVRATTTERSYALYALSGGPPQRPGMLRVADGDGQAIAVEVWALPPDGFGRFVAGIPAPLGIGTIRLEGGTQAKGFLVEPQGVVGAKDISHFGGWRQYIAANDKTA
jgi:allophanate hydrolase